MRSGLLPLVFFLEFRRRGFARALRMPFAPPMDIRLTGPRRGILNHCIDFGSDENRETAQVEPQKQDDNGSEGPVDGPIVPEVRQVDAQSGRREEPDGQGGNGTGCDPRLSRRLKVRAETVYERQREQDEEEH